MNIYKGLSLAETGGEENPYIRTRVIPEGGSSAFGPVQITRGLLNDVIDRNLLSPESVQFTQEIMLPMQQQMIKYGADDMIPGKEMYGYGETGGFDVEAYGDNYKKLANELIQLKLKESMDEKGNVDMDKFLTRWRGKKPEKNYRKKFFKGLNKKNSHYKED